MKKTGVILAVILALLVVSIPSLAQSPYTDYVCGSVQVFNQPDGNTLVRCYPPDEATATPTVTARPTNTPRATSTPAATATTAPGGRAIVVDSRSLALFDQIPESYLAAARALKVVFSDRSVGQNINESLDCLAAASYGTSPSYCRRGWVDSSFVGTRVYNQANYDANQVPQFLRFDPSPTRYNRGNISFAYREGDWSTLTQDFVTSLAPSYGPSNDILTYQFSYLNVDAGSDIQNFFSNGSRYDVYDLQNYIDTHPQDRFFLWTTSLARTIGTSESTQFNDSMRAYAAQHNLPLLDMADITSTAPDGSRCMDSSGRYPVICQDYTTEANGGHLGSVSGGRIRMAKAFWVMLAQMAGWQP